MKFEEEMLTYALKNLKEKYGEKSKEIFGKEIVVPTLPFPRIKLADLYAELKAMYGFEVPAEEMNDLTTEAERLCKKFAMDKYGHEFLFVTDYPKDKRAFYHMRKDGIPQGYDLIWNGVEITTGAQREHRYDILKAQAQEKGLDNDVKFYLEFFKYGCPPHGGFGLGVDRLTMILTDYTIKEVEFLFRGPNRITRKNENRGFSSFLCERFISFQSKILKGQMTKNQRLSAFLYFSVMVHRILYWECLHFM